MRALAWLLLAACDVHPELGLDAELTVVGGQYRPGPFPADEGGPATVDLRTRHSELPTNHLTEPFDATLDIPARVAAVGVAGVDGAWLVVAGPPDLDAPNQPTATARFGVKTAGPFDLVVAAADGDGRFGPPRAVRLIANDDPPPAGTLVVALIWQGDADLDLHVIDPLGGEAYSDDPNTWEPPPPGTPTQPGEPWLAGGILDHDGNKDCVREARPNEHVIWTRPPPPGEYVVRVDARAMCGAASADWYVAAYRGEELLGAARGVSVADDVRHPHGRGAGVLALRLTLP